MTANHPDIQPTLKQMSKLPSDPISRIPLSFFVNVGKPNALESVVQQNAQDYKALLENDASRYHLYYNKNTPLMEKQAHLYVQDKKLMLHCHGKDPIQIYPSLTQSAANAGQYMVSFGKSTQTADSAQLEKIRKKVQNHQPLTRSQIDLVFQKASLITMQQTQDPLLQAMDDYLLSTTRKSNAGKINSVTASHKIQVTQALMVFLENPTQKNWSTVRKKMHECPRYAFSWTGLSQADTFLNITRALYKHEISSFDEEYNRQNPKQADTSWGRFVYNFGFIYYFASAPLFVGKLLSFIVTSVRRLSLHEDLKTIKGYMDLLGLQGNSKASIMIEKLDNYLSEDDDCMTEEVLEYMQDFEEKLTEVWQEIETASCMPALDQVKNNINRLLSSVSTKIIHLVGSTTTNLVDTTTNQVAPR